MAKRIDAHCLANKLHIANDREGLQDMAFESILFLTDNELTELFCAFDNALKNKVQRALLFASCV